MRKSGCSSVQAVILCGGQGTRIRDAGENLPKPMLPIGGKPILWHIMKIYAAAGLKDFVLCLGYKGWIIKDFFLNYDARLCDTVVEIGARRRVSFLGSNHNENWTVTLAETGESSQTGARVAAVRSYVQDSEIFCLTYGDGVADIDVKSLLKFHRSHGKIATVTAVRPPGRFGEMVVDGRRVVEFNEKPQATAGIINGGFFVFDSKRIWDYLSGGSELVLEKEPLRQLARDGQLAAYSHKGFWQPMDTLREYNLFNQMWDSGKAPWKVWGNRI
ncbi:MAG: glucose-1-phosphate cytidylyltransferase [Rhodocyclales bacterium GWA2_65_19]|nr:MAG: glucose-1-phosphate cytidylyltransferase [Rhodocyclales bacterium GWA2_65_19]